MAETNSGDTSPGSSSPSPATQDPDPEPTPGESSTKPSRYELQKLRDWKSFRRYLNNHDPTLSLATCTGSDVVEFLKHLDQVGKTKIHVTGCAFFGHPKPPSPCDCPLRQSWGNLDSLIYRLRALYEEKRCNPGTNPFGAPDVQGYLREVRQYQARARGIDYGKKRKQQLPALPIIDPPDPKKHSSAMYGYETGGALIPRTQNQLGPYVPAVPIWIRPPDLPIQYWASTMLNSIPTGTQEKGHIDWEESESVVPPTVRRNASMKDGITEQPPKGILKKPRASIEPKKQHQQKEMIEVELPMVVVVPVCGSGIDGSRVLSWRDDRVASLIISRIQLQIGSTELGYPIINKERFGRELEALEERGEKWSNPWFLSLLDDTLRGLPRALRGLEVKVRRGCECGKVRWVDQVETVVEGIDV